MKRSAIFEGKYRYSLKREWDNSRGKVVFIMLNPSLADENEDDPTTKRCIYYAKKFGYGSLEIVNLFSYITPHPNDLKALDKNKAIGNENYNYLVKALNSTEKIIAAWGENGTIHKRHKEIEEVIEGYDVDCFGTVKSNDQPRHPLYLPNDIELIPYKRPKNKVSRLVREKGIEGYKEFLMKEYHLGESSANDYVGRFNGIVKRGLFKGEKELTPALKAAIEEVYPNSKNHYVLTIERYIEFQHKM